MNRKFHSISRRIVKCHTFRCTARHSSSSEKLTHLDDEGRVRMVDVSDKVATKRTARAKATVELGESVYKVVESSMCSGKWKKGDILTVAEIAGVQAAKSTSNMIPLCHQVPLSHVSVSVEPRSPAFIDIQATASTTAATGVEMEALSAASVAALTVYDMCKAAGKGIVIRDIHLLEKTGGRSGNFRANLKPNDHPLSTSTEDKSKAS